MLPSSGMSAGLNSMAGARPAAPGAQAGSSVAQPSAHKEIVPPKCFGTDYFGKWNTTGMTFESMKIDRPDYQSKCCNCQVFNQCYLVNHIRLLRIKR